MRFTLSAIIVASACVAVALLAYRVSAIEPYLLCAFVFVMACFVNATSNRTRA